jgi:cytochrome P450
MDATVRKLGMYQANIDAEAEHLVKGLRATKGVPVNPGDYMMLYTYNVIKGIMFDLRFDEPSDSWIREEVKLQEQFFQLTSFSTNLSNYFPFLRLLPQKWVGCRPQDCHEWRAKFDERMEIMFEKLRKRIVDGENVQSCCAELQEREKTGDIDHYELLGMCTSIIGAGVVSDRLTFECITGYE